MSFIMAELVTTAVIENRLLYLSQHPDHINWMLAPFVTNKEVGRLVDARYVAECIKYITTVRPMVRPLYETDMAKLPSIIVASHQGEAQQFLGDYGGSVCAGDVSPTILLTFNAIGATSNTLITTDNQNVEETVWPGLYLRSGDFVSRINSVYKLNGDVIVQLDKDLPSGVSLRNCEVITSANQKIYEFGSSIDNVVVNITLSTSGDHAIHRLMSTVLRYCLKSGRMLFDSYGMQVATFSQQQVIVADETQLVWQTNFVAEAKITDHWITDESNLIGAPMTVDMIADNGEGQLVPMYEE